MYTYIYSHTHKHIYIHSHRHSQVFSHSHANTNPACGSAWGVRRLPLGTQPVQPTESMRTAGRQQAEPPGEEQSLSPQAPPCCLKVWTWGRVWSHSLALPQREKTGWLCHHWDLLGSTVLPTRKHFCPSAQNQACGHEIPAFMKRASPTRPSLSKFTPKGKYLPSWRFR